MSPESIGFLLLEWVVLFTDKKESEKVSQKVTCKNQQIQILPKQLANIFPAKGSLQES